MRQNLIDTHSLLYACFSVLHALLVDYPSDFVTVAGAIFYKQVGPASGWEHVRSREGRKWNQRSKARWSQKTAGQIERGGVTLTYPSTLSLTLTANICCAHNIVYVQSILFTGNIYLGVAELNLLITFVKSNYSTYCMHGGWYSTTSCMQDMATLGNAALIN